MLFLIAFAAFVSTILGGLFALRLRDRLHLVLGFSAGAIIGVAFFDLLPEALEIVGDAYEPHFVTTIIAVGFLIYLILDRFFFTHSHTDSEQTSRSFFGAGSISFHSFLDGIGIGLAFQVSPALGVIVTTAVLIHNFSDGINTVSMILKNNGDKITAYKWLFVDGLAPALGIFVSQFFTLKESSIGLFLALFTGFFLYIGASDLLPESHHRHPVIWTTLATILGMVVIYIAIQLSA